MKGPYTVAVSQHSIFSSGRARLTPVGITPVVVVLVLGRKLSTLLLSALARFLVILFQPLVLNLSKSVLHFFNVACCDEAFV